MPILMLMGLGCRRVHRLVSTRKQRINQRRVKVLRRPLTAEAAQPAIVGTDYLRKPILKLPVLILGTFRRFSLWASA